MCINYDFIFDTHSEQAERNLFWMNQSYICVLLSYKFPPVYTNILKEFFFTFMKSNRFYCITKYANSRLMNRLEAGGFIYKYMILTTFDVVFGKASSLCCNLIFHNINSLFTYMSLNSQYNKKFNSNERFLFGPYLHLHGLDFT